MLFGSQWSDYIVYVDESGDHSLTSINKDYPVFVLALCVFHKRYYAETIIPALTRFKFQHFGHDIRKEENGFNFRNRASKNAFMEKLGNTIELRLNFVCRVCTIF